MSTKIFVSPRRQTALQWAALGYRVFPLQPGSKSEQVLKSWKKEASDDVSQINRWWDEKDYNVACVVENGHCVVDPDTHEGQQAFDALGAPDTYTVSTPGGGRHYHFDGDLPNTVGYLAPKVDTRGSLTGRPGYVLLPGSVVEGKSYAVEAGGELLTHRTLGGFAPLPDAVVEKFKNYKSRAENVPTVNNSPKGEVHRDTALFVAWEWLKSQPVPEPGDRDTKTFTLVAKLRDFGVDYADRVALIERTGNQIHPLDLERINDSVERGNTQNPEGILAPVDPFGDLAAPAATQAQRVAKFRLYAPDEGLHLPDLEFWDKERTLPHKAIVVAYGPSGDLKTTLLICDCLDALEKGARVLFAVGEGAHGFIKHRLPAAIVARGKKPSEYRGQWFSCDAVPMLTDTADVAAFIAAVKDFDPDVVVIDTLAAASGGLDENSSAFGASLTSTGPVGRIRRELECAVILVHHTGKDLAKGSRGHSSIKGNSDGMWFITAEKPARRITKEIEKMRDAADGFTIEYEYSEGLPVAKCRGKRATISKADPLVDEIARLFAREKYFTNDPNNCPTLKEAAALEGMPVTYAELKRMIYPSGSGKAGKGAGLVCRATDGSLRLGARPAPVEPLAT